ncbi:MAG TPA: hypothetical protein VF771_00445 [Longimicrobiaceae bacterium]
MVETEVGTALAQWETFYVITGAAAAALTGLQFVVVTLIDARTGESGGPETTSDTLGAFGTPTVVHFAAALLLASMISAPWRALGPLRVALLLAGGAGLVYGAIILLRARRQKAYQPVLEDWIWHVVLPIVAYGGVVAAGGMLERDISDALFIAGGVTLLLLFIGIHNAWDTVAYLAVQRAQGHSSQATGAAPPPKPQSSGRRNRRRR